jgi:hypothetical protein
MRILRGGNPQRPYGPLVLSRAQLVLSRAHKQTGSIEAFTKLSEAIVHCVRPAMLSVPAAETVDGLWALPLQAVPPRVLAPEAGQIKASGTCCTAEFRVLLTARLGLLGVINRNAQCEHFGSGIVLREADTAMTDLSGRRTVHQGARSHAARNAAFGFS